MKMNKKKIVIFGGQGFIGLNLAKYFLKYYKSQLILIGNKSSLKNKIFLKKERKRIIFCENDIFDLKKVEKLELKNSIVIFAALKKDKLKLKILNQIKNLLICLNNKQVRSFFLLSSVSVYGNFSKSLSENIKTKPLNDYAKNCLNIEKLCSKIFSKSLTNLIILRIAQTFGKFNLKYGLIEKILKFYLKKAKFTFNDIDLIRSHISALKLVKIIDNLSKKKINNEIINVANPFYVFSFNELIDKMNNILGFKRTINFKKQQYIIKKSICYATKLQKKYGIKFQNSFSFEIKEVIKYFRKYEWS